MLRLKSAALLADMIARPTVAALDLGRAAFHRRARGLCTEDARMQASALNGAKVGVEAGVKSATAMKLRYADRYKKLNKCFILSSTAWDDFGPKLAPIFRTALDVDKNNHAVTTYE